ncbi:MAG: PAS domain S-box protein, partial [Methanomassiliicoccales archaeon]
VKASAAQILKGKSTLPYEYRVITKTGELKWVSEIVTPIRYKGKRAVLGNFMDISERKLTKLKLKQSRESYRTLFNQSPEAIMLIDFNGKILDCNEATSNLVGRPKDKIIGSSFKKLGFMGAGDKDGDFNPLSMFQTGDYIGPGLVQFEVKNEKNVKSWLEVFPALLKKDDKEYAVQTIIRDITERKQSEEALRQSEQRFRELADFLPQIIFELDLEGNITFVNHFAFDLSGYTTEEYQNGLNAIQMFVNEDRERILNDIERVLRGEDVGGIEYTFLKKDGTTIPVIAYAAPIVRANKTVGIRGIVIDITDRKRMEEQLIESEERYRSFAENLPGITFKLDTDFKPIFFHGAVQEIFGHNIQEITAERLRWDQVVHPADLPKINHAIEEVLSRPNYSVEFETRIIHKDGSTHWIHIFIQSVWDENDTPQYLHGLIFDITERKLAEEALKESEQRFMSIFENAMDGIVLVDLNTKNFYLGNKMICQMLGYQSDEFKTLNFLDIHPKKDLPFIFERYDKQMKGEITTAENIPMVRKDGSTLYADINSTPITFAGKEYLLGFYRDITDRKNREVELKGHSEHLEALLKQSISELKPSYDKTQPETGNDDET